MDREINVKMGKALAKARLSLGLTQQDVADLSGIERTHIAKVETGHLDCKLWKVEEIANAIGYHIELVRD